MFGMELASWTVAMTAPRIIVPGATIAMTRRTTLRKAFLSPWHPLVKDVWLYSLAHAQREKSVAVHHGALVINHEHLTVTSEHDNLPQFAELLHREVSKGLNTLLTRERYDSPRELFDGREPHYMRLMDSAAQASHLVYEYNNCVAASLVKRAEHMPGRVFDFDLWKRGYVDVQRPAVYFSDNRPDVLRLYVTPPPLLFAAFGGDLDRLVYHMKRLAEHGGRELRAGMRRSPLGARGVLRIHPWNEPRSLRESGGERVPSFKVGAFDIAGRQGRIQCAKETRLFWHEYREARLARKAGDLEAAFPFGTYGMRMHHGVPVVSEPYDGALLTQPGPTLDDVMAELEMQRGAPLGEEATHLINDVRDAFADEAVALCEETGMEFERSVSGASRVDSTHYSDVSTVTDDSPSTAVVRHRFDRCGDAESVARRIITLRDKRRGRPSATHSTKGGADPPA